MWLFRASVAKGQLERVGYRAAAALERSRCPRPPRPDGRAREGGGCEADGATVAEWPANGGGGGGGLHSRGQRG